MQLNAYIVDSFQKCGRIPRLLKDHRLRKLEPMRLFSSCMRECILNMSSGMSKEKAVHFATTRFLTQAKDPGLQIPHGIDTYTYAMDLVAMIRTLSEYLSRLTLLRLHDTSGDVNYVGNNHIEWTLLSPMDDSGALHRWVFLDSKPNDNDMDAQLHSWYVVGDMAAAAIPMTLHVVVVGRRRKSRHNSPWTRAFRQPGFYRHRFQKLDGTSLSGNWKPVYFADGDSSAEAWVDLMQEENVPDTLVRHFPLTDLSGDTIQNFHAEVDTLYEQIRNTMAQDPRSIPMTRRSCNRPKECAHLGFCYSNQTQEQTGLYTPEEELVRG